MGDGFQGQGHIQPFGDFAAQPLIVQITAKKDSLDRLPQLGERFVRRVLYVFLGEAPQDGFGFRCTETQCGSVFDHLVVLLPHSIVW